MNASELDTTPFVWALLIVPAFGLLLGIGLGWAAHRRGWRHPVLAGLAAVVVGVIAGWVGMAIYDELN